MAAPAGGCSGLRRRARTYDCNVLLVCGAPMRKLTLVTRAANKPHRNAYSCGPQPCRLRVLAPPARGGRCVRHKGTLKYCDWITQGAESAPVLRNANASRPHLAAA
ncbi:hypothetical protein RR48_13846 [Papilio machaon]|uniref:Uncharacterized protein n=1 Tax=Papilio machaon TaxID=76193 RepID=A0A194RI34_PAPMA|nr:hypothetical protein RR48_13846 [Papilio machaon]